MLLEVVAFTADVRGHLVAVGQAHTADLPQCGVRLLRGGGVDAGADAALLRAGLKRRHVGLRGLTLARLAHELINRCHSC